ncbi:MAG: SusC/RagA family TonB-linked outer membrane protein [Tannerella sp.]|jgi:iron complex outermembrane receptor protein|nr:SusC/RagA family TonB-linked outer membrane protein [Tannerella sp.]
MMCTGTGAAMAGMTYSPETELASRFAEVSTREVVGEMEERSEKQLSASVAPEYLPERQQDRRSIAGTVTDASGEVVGANIMEKGTTNGTITDANGRFSLNVLPGATLVVSFIGYHTQEIAVGDRSSLDILLVEDTQMMDEVVVTAFGQKRELKTLGYSISSVSAKELTVSGVAMNPIQSLYGKVSGVTLRQGASGPTGGIDFKIRAAAGLESSAKTRPLFVVDGTPIFDEESGFGVNNRTYDYGSGINDLNPEDIESMDILKGAKASVLYGSQGANGVVLITTKSGKDKQGLGIDFSYQSTIEQPKTYMQFQNTYGPGTSPYETRETIEIGGRTYGKALTSQRNFGPAFNGEDIYWYDGQVRPYLAEGTGIANGGSDAFMSNFRTGFSNQATFAIAGNGGFGNARLGYTYYDYQGIQDNFSQKKNSISFASTLKPSKRVSVDVNSNIYFINTVNRMGQTNNMVQGFQRDVPYNEFKEYYKITDPEDRNYGYKTNLEARGWPTGYYYLKEYLGGFWDRDRNRETDDKFHMVASVKPTIHFTNEVYFIGYAGIDYTDIDYTTQLGVTQVYPQINGGKYGFERRNTKVQEYRAFLNFEKPFANDRLGVHIYGGPLYRSLKENTIYTGTEGNLLYPDWFHIKNQDPSNWPSAGSWDKVLNNTFYATSMYSLLGVATLSWDDGIYLELNGRNDWSSTLPVENNSYFYPGAALTWILSKYVRVPEMQFAKVRMSFADVGREAPTAHYAFQSYTSSKLNGTDAYKVEAQSSLFAGALKPERKRELEVGFDVLFFPEARLGLDASFYTNNIYDQIMAIPLSQVTGATEIKINAGNVQNWGYELQLKGTPVLTKDFRWNVIFNTANQYSKIKKLYPGITQKNVYDIGGQTYVQAREGQRVGDIWGHAVRLSPDGQRIVSGASYSLDDKNLSKMGNVFPDFLGGLTTDLTYKDFSLNLVFDYKFGATLFSWTNYWMLYNGISMESMQYRDEAHGGMAYYINANNEKVAWQHDQSAPAESKDQHVYHDGLILPGVVERVENGNTTYTPNTQIVSAPEYYSSYARWTNETMNAVDSKFKNDYIKVREIGLTYTAPRKVARKLFVQNLRVTLFARNLWYLYKTLPNLDPESAMGTNSYIEFSPNPTQQTFGLNIGIGL